MKRRNKINHGWKGALGQALLYLFLTALLVVTVFPIVYSLSSSLKSTQEILSSKAFWPKEIHFENYSQAWTQSNFGRYFWNSSYLAFFVVLGTIITSTTAGYVFARGRFPGKNLVYVVLTSSMFISAGSLYLYPQLQIAKVLGLNTSLWGVIVINIFGINITQLYISRSYIQSISPEIDEAAKIDGCSFFWTFCKIIFPLTKPLIATIGLLSFMNAWNDYLLPLVFTLGNKASQPLVVGIIAMRNIGESVTAWNLMLAGTSMAVLPMLVVYLFLNKYFIAGLTSGAVKG